MNTLALDIENVTKIYGHNFKALNNLSLKINQGDFFALLGPNGAGKSTTINIISSLTAKTSGTVKIMGYDLDKETEVAKKQIGLVPQEFNFNQYEKIIDIVVQQAGYFGVPRNEALMRAEQYLKKLDLWDKRKEPSRNLSGGMKRRLMIARALMHEPKLLILDEPTAGVDIELRREMWDFLKEINQLGVTIILTTHYLEEAELLCKNIGIIESGILIKNTSMRNLLNQLDEETFLFDTAPFEKELTFKDVLSYKKIDDDLIEITINKNKSLNNIFSQLIEQGVLIKSMRNKANRLEELFIKIIKRSS